MLLVTAATSPGDESLEQLPRPRQVGGELFGMALDRDDQPVVRFNTLHSSVLAAGGLLQAGAKPLDRLVMEAVDPDLVLAGRSAKLGCRVDVDGGSEATAPHRADPFAPHSPHRPPP